MISQYISFNKNTTGDDGCTYYAGVKYRIKNDDGESICIAGNKNSINKFIKSDIKNISTIGNVVKESRK